MKLCTFVNDNFESCDKPREGNTMCCATHNRIVRKQLTDSRKQAEKRKMLLSKPKKIYAKPNKVSEKRKVLNEEYSVLRERFLIENPNCKVQLVGCLVNSVEVHHKASGSNKVANLNNVATWLPVCSHCHRILHDKLSAMEAREKGLKL